MSIGLYFRRDSPQSLISPYCGFRKLVMILIIVDFPEPFGPSMERKSPSSIEKLTSFLPRNIYLTQY